MDDHESFGIAELAERGGVNRRTVRYYVQRGLLPAPTGTGRGPHYTGRHLAVLLQIRAWQEANISLDEIAARLAGRPAPAPPPQASPPPRAPNPLADTWIRHVLADGVELFVRADRMAPSPELLERAAAVLRGHGQGA